jgi:hypothetical protein
MPYPGSNGSYSDILNRYADRVRISENDPGWEDIWPTETRGDGKVRKNNANTGGAQGKGTLLRKAPCDKCGFVNDLTAIDHTGGSLDGNGAMGAITLGTSTWNTSAPPSINGQTYTGTESYGTQAHNKNAGCGHCGSKNSTKVRIIIDYVSPLNQPLGLGF